MACPPTFTHGHKKPSRESLLRTAVSLQARTLNPSPEETTVELAGNLLGEILLYFEETDHSSTLPTNGNTPLHLALLEDLTDICIEAMHDMPSAGQRLSEFLGQRLIPYLCAPPESH